MAAYPQLFSRYNLQRAQICCSLPSRLPTHPAKQPARPPARPPVMLSPGLLTIVAPQARAMRLLSVLRRRRSAVTPAFIR